MLHIKNAQILNVFTEEFEKTELWIENNQIVFRGPSAQLVADETFDAHNQYIVPGMIDAHMHIESSLLRPAELGRLLAKHGVTSAVADPHELASVAGTAGLNYMLDDARKTPVRYFFMLPSSVPATPFERTGAVLDAASLAPFYDEPEVNGLAEVMDFPAVAQKQADMLQKIADANAHGKHADGHASGLSREQLAVYRQYGIKTDHEATSVQEAQERLDAGMSVLIRQGTVEADELALLPAVTPINQRAFSFATDDKSVHDLVQEGSIDENVRLAIKAGIRPEQAFTMASYHAALAEELDNIGALTDGYLADLVVLPEKNAVAPTQVMINGAWIDEKATVAPSADFRVPLDVSLTASDLALPIKADQPAHVIKIMPHHITTEHVEVPVPSQGGLFSPNATFSKIAVAERYHDLGHGVGIIEGLGIKQGAIGATVAHDSHNLILAGHDDESMALAAAALRDMDGGQVVVIDPDHIVTLPLPVGGLMSDQPYETVDTENQKLQAAFQQISDITFDPFLTLSFMALPVIPSLKITDQGLFDFNQFKFINLQD
ncbi:adenine deaminase [Weissella viridescens]|uniref:Adenine deaminase n=1 Tax=Weissella viridescens TaxID=1629 RepID=A0A3P2RAT1_WEIVI|nr:adenine deaminase [Weissella viridescens]RRG17604.1 adenine deaminase [Weissella viridescens]